MDTVLVCFIVIPIYIILGGFWISEVIRDYKRDRYFLFGTDAMTAIYFIGLLIKNIFFNF